MKTARVGDHRPGAWRGALILLLAASFLKGLVWMASLPPWEGPDEPAHFAYVRTLAEEHRLPVFGPDQFDADLLRTLRTTQFATDDWLSQRDFGPGRDGPGEATLPPGRTPSDQLARRGDSAGAYAPVYYLAAVPFYYLGRPWGIIGSLYAVRLLDLILGLLAVYCTVCAGRALWPTSGGLPLVAGGLLAFQPMFTQGTAMVNNDAGAYALGAAAIAVGTTALRGAPSWRWGAAVGALVGLGFVIKPVAALVGGALVVLFLLRAATARAMRSALAEAGAAVVAGFATAGSWVVFSYITRGGAASQLNDFAPSGSHSLRSYLALVRADNFHYLASTWIDSVWGNFAWLNTRLPTGAYFAIGSVLVLAAAGLLFCFAPLRRVRLSTAGPLPTQVLFLVSAVVGGMVFLQITDGLFFLRSGGLLLQGRYLLTAGSALVLCLLIGTTAWVAPRFHAAAAMTLLGGMIALNALSVGVLWQRFYE